MTTTAAEGRTEEDFWVDLLPEAAELVIRSGLGSTAMLIRKMRIPHGLASDLMLELHELGVVGPDANPREVLVAVDQLPRVLTEIAELAAWGVSRDDDPPGSIPAEEPVVLTKPPTEPDGDDEDDVSSGDLVVRPDDDLLLPPTAELARRPVIDVVVRARQASARGAVWVVDQPVVSRSLVVGRQTLLVPPRLAKWTPRGMLRAARMVWAWLTDAQSAALLAGHAERGEGESYAKVAQARASAGLVGRRWLAAFLVALVVLLALAWWVPGAFAVVLAVLVFTGCCVVIPRQNVKELGFGLVGASGLALAVWWKGQDLAGLIPQPPWWLWWVLAGVAVVVFGLLGRKPDQRLVEMPVGMASTKPPTITAPMVIGALVALGNSKMKEPNDVRVLMDPHRAGPGVQIDLELPGSVIAAWVMGNREPLAAAMRRNMGTVWPSVGPTHPGHLRVFISDLPVTETEQEPWPLLTCGPIDIFAPQPVFTDQLGKWVYLNLAYASWVIGAVPRMGKTFLVRELLLIYGMDPRVKVIALDGKGTGDLSPLVPFAHTHVRGARVDKPEGIETVRATVAWLLKEMGRRADVLASLPAEEAPESKVTSELVNAHPELDLGPIVFGMDETQNFFSYGFRRDREHKEIREEIRDGVIELMRMGPATGIWVILATQTVRDSTIPSEAQAVAVYRYALKMEGWEPNDKVLGTGAFKSGVDATMFGFDEKGIGWLKGEGAKPQITRSVVGLDAVQARTAAQRCRAFRVAKNLLTGEAGTDGIVDAEVVYDVVADAEQVISSRGCGKAQWGELVAWLRDLRPGQYATLTEEELSAGIRAAGVKVRDVRSGESVRKGIYISDLRKRGGSDDEF